MDIAEVHALLVPELHERMTQVAEEHRAADLAVTYAELSSLFASLGLCHLLEFVDHEAFAENLCRSGHARRAFLRRARKDSLSDEPRLALSYTQALLDTLVAGDLELAGDIAALSATEWRPDWEYEEDYLFFVFLHRMVLGLHANAPQTKKDLVELLDRFQAVLEGAQAARLAVCRALVARDAAAFTEALADRLREISMALDAERQSAAVQEDFDVGFWPRSFVSIEGLALLQLAGSLGIHATRELPMCPQIARLPLRPNKYQDFFIELEQET